MHVLRIHFVLTMGQKKLFFKAKKQIGDTKGMLIRFQGVQGIKHRKRSEIEYRPSATLLYTCY